ncbi:MAG: type II toxin-antitoxin system VapC family toxin [Spirochaetales bacterium]|nr:type II toxin-antitoxin system VapC family toxin [Leptospiraceae bacterium]MCP5482704.1 type II toxin-antitoxin system VapC family toxin [Spirochaetales bacterium]MCP5485086.1 type II toxin-antitoxin system VapC family toxin [Spirochaetales bacterium]
MRLCLDTNTYVALARGEPALGDIVRQAGRVHLPFIALAELRAGFRSGKKTSQNERNLQRFLGVERVSVLFADEQTTHHYASLFARLRAQGTPIPTNDLWIAALVLQHDLLLCSFDSHFNHLPQLPRVGPTNE